MLQEFCQSHCLLRDSDGFLIPYIYLKKVCNPEPRYMFVFVKDEFGRLYDITPMIIADTGMKFSKAKGLIGALIVHGYGMDMCFQLTCMLNKRYQASVFSPFYKTIKLPEIKKESYTPDVALPKHQNFDDSLWHLSWNAFKTYVKETTTAKELYDRMYRTNQYCPSLEIFSRVYDLTKLAFMQKAY